MQKKSRKLIYLLLILILGLNSIESGYVQSFTFLFSNFLVVTQENYFKVISLIFSFIQSFLI